MRCCRGRRIQGRRVWRLLCDDSVHVVGGKYDKGKLNIKVWMKLFPAALLARLVVLGLLHRRSHGRGGPPSHLVAIFVRGGPRSCTSLSAWGERGAPVEGESSCTRCSRSWSGVGSGCVRGLNGVCVKVPPTTSRPSRHVATSLGRWFSSSSRSREGGLSGRTRSVGGPRRTASAPPRGRSTGRRRSRSHGVQQTAAFAGGSGQGAKRFAGSITAEGWRMGDEGAGWRAQQAVGFDGCAAGSGPEMAAGAPRVIWQGKQALVGEQSMGDGSIRGRRDVGWRLLGSGASEKQTTREGPAHGPPGHGQWL